MMPTRRFERSPFWGVERQLLRFLAASTQRKRRHAKPCFQMSLADTGNSSCPVRYRARQSRLPMLYATAPPSRALALHSHELWQGLRRPFLLAPHCCPTDSRTIHALTPWLVDNPVRSAHSRLALARRGQAVRHQHTFRKYALSASPVAHSLLHR